MDARYMDLVARCPLLPITNKSEHDAAKRMMVELSKRDGAMTKPEIGYGQVLVQLIQAYERKIVGDYFENVSGGDVLEYLLTEHQIRQTEAAKIAGVTKQNLNDFLKARRGLPKEARERLAAHFKVNPEIFELEKKLASA
jgi:antitoxin component HigA of HigAB toxin-antitoxin module